MPGFFLAQFEQAILKLWLIELVHG
jgi:hypothetical protein